MSDSAYDEWLDAVAAGEGYYLECPEGHGYLPPKLVCPHTGATEFVERPLPESGSVETTSVIHVSTPEFDEETPYATAIASFGPVRITGVVRGVDPESVEVGTAVEVTVEERRGDDGRVVVFRPR
ncbi:Zn-ribbon domain-containing OB-fold protein [Haloferacaceae archaeon DSL9]